jgi:hypothetical protein
VITGTLEQGKNAGLRTIDDALEDDALEKTCPSPTPARTRADHATTARLAKIIARLIVTRS